MTVRARIACFAALVSHASGVSAASLGKSELVWEAPPDCPARAEVSAEFARLIAERSERTVQARAVVVPRGDGYHLTLHTRVGDEVGQREMSAASCDALATTALAILGWMLHEERARVEPASPSRERAVELRPSAGARVAFDAGSLPEPTLGAGVSAGLQYGSLGVELLVTYFLPRTASAVREGREGSGEFALLSVGLSPCWSPFQGDLRISGCVLAEGGVISGRGRGDLQRAFTEIASWWAAGLSLGLVYSPTRAHALSLPRIDLLTSLNRRDWVLQDAGADPVLLYRPSAVIFRAATGVVFQ